MTTFGWPDPFHDPGVGEFGLINAVFPVQAQLDAILYPNVADDAAVVKELISRFNGRQGLYALQTGAGFTRRTLMPPLRRLAPRVLAFAHNYQAEA
jgi:hypothetical protein